MPLFEKIVTVCWIWFAFVGYMMDYSVGWGLLTGILPAVYLFVVLISGITWFPDKYRGDGDGDGGDDGGGY